MRCDRRSGFEKRPPATSRQTVFYIVLLRMPELVQLVRLALYIALIGDDCIQSEMAVLRSGGMSTLRLPG